MRTNCGLRTVVKILEIFYEVLEGKCGKVPCYNTVENWMKKLGLSVYQVGPGFKGDDIKQEIENSIKEIGHSPEYIISDQAHNLTNGISKSGLQHHLDISHAMGTCLKHAYGSQADFVAFTSLLGKIRLQYHLTDKTYLYLQICVV